MDEERSLCLFYTFFIFSTLNVYTEHADLWFEQHLGGVYFGMKKK